MKKNFIFVLFLLIIFAFAGCNSGGGNNSSNSGNSLRLGYYYMWSNNSPAFAYTKQLSIFSSSIVYAEEPTEPAKYLGSEIPPFSSVDDGGRPCGFLLIFTYYNGVEVKSACTVDPNDGEIGEYNLNNDYIVPSFIAKRQGLFHVTATYNGEVLDIPVRIYHFGTINLPRMDLDSDGILDIDNFSARYGYQTINSHLSLVLSAPAGNYVETPLTQFTFGKIYVIKTSSGKYCKIWPTGYAGESSYNGMDFLSDENGNFAY